MFCRPTLTLTLTLTPRGTWSKHETRLLNIVKHKAPADAIGPRALRACTGAGSVGVGLGPSDFRLGFVLIDVIVRFRVRVRVRVRRSLRV